MCEKFSPKVSDVFVPLLWESVLFEIREECVFLPNDKFGVREI